MKTRKQTIQMLEKLTSSLRGLHAYILCAADLTDKFEPSPILWREDFERIAAELQSSIETIYPFLPEYLQEVYAEVDAMNRADREQNNQEAAS